MLRHLALALTLSSLTLFPASSEAHIDIDFPGMRGGNQKVGPCEGLNYGESQLSTFRPGSELTIKINETINHPGHLRVMLDTNMADGEDFPDPVNCDDVQAVGDIGNGMYVLGDNMMPEQGATCPGFHTPSLRPDSSFYDLTVTLPDIECDDCTLQVIQVMTDAGKAAADGTWDPAGGRGLYFRCADVRLSNGGDVTEQPIDDNPGGGNGDGNGGGDGGGGGATPPLNSDNINAATGGCSSSGSGLPHWVFALMAFGFYGFRARKIKVSPRDTSS